MPRTAVEAWEAGCIQGAKFRITGARTSWGGTDQRRRTSGEVGRNRVQYAEAISCAVENGSGWVKPRTLKRPGRRHGWVLWLRGSGGQDRPRG